MELIEVESLIWAQRKKKILDRQQIASQWGLQLIFRMHNSDPTPQGVDNRNIFLWFKCVLTLMHMAERIFKASDG
jgi:hypothetical protein